MRALCLTASFARFQAAPDYPEGLSNQALAKMVAPVEAEQIVVVLQVPGPLVKVITAAMVEDLQEEAAEAEVPALLGPQDHHKMLEMVVVV